MVQRIAVPANSLIASYQAEIGGFADSFRAMVPGTVTLSDYVTAFYTTRLFRTERALLGLAGQGSRDHEIAALFDGTGTDFAVWRLWQRTEDELLMREKSGATASWFRARPTPEGTELCFGSAVRPKSTGGALPGPYRVLLGFHLLYSRALLSAASKRLTRRAPQPEQRAT
ncbi:hypothetical protein [Pseudooceanicola sp.]|uniref:hypothetical protein n=1 Tax=Pseudooceanicola sp. TaxID=1914328 RepID=UPI0035C6EFCE